MRALCERLQLNATFLEGIRCEPRFIGCTLSHLRAYIRANRNAPFLVLEDDVDFTEDFHNVVSIPDDTDAFYLGVSSCGCVADLGNRGFEGAVVVTRYNDSIMKVHNMTGAHAILINSNCFLEAAINIMLESLVEGFRPHDIELTKLQGRYNVYALERPFFFQAAHLQSGKVQNAQERMTKIILRTPAIAQNLVFDDRNGRIALQLVTDGNSIPRWISRRL